MPYIFHTFFSTFTFHTQMLNVLALRSKHNLYFGCIHTMKLCCNNIPVIIIDWNNIISFSFQFYFQFFFGTIASIAETWQLCFKQSFFLVLSTNLLAVIWKSIENWIHMHFADVLSIYWILLNAKLLWEGKKGTAIKFLWWIHRHF